jgi:RHS repeat-associated protein
MSVLVKEIRAKGCFPREVTGRSNPARLGPQPDEERDASGKTVKRFYVHGFQSVSGGVATNYYYTRNHLGSIREVVDGSGSVKSRYDYDPYGRRTLVSGNDLADFGFTGFLYHKSTGLNLTLFRAYDSDLGRWLSRDPIGERGGLNLYGYVGNNPVNATDLLGLFPPSHPFCQKLKQTIENKKCDIQKRIGEFHEDKLTLPWRAPGDVQKPSLSRWGHLKIINMTKAGLAADEAMYSARCSDDEPPSSGQCPMQPQAIPAMTPQQQATTIGVGTVLIIIFMSAFAPAPN